ncbi:MAG: MATE family efflux transporter, partial [Actinomycetota bacterium]|nr:MATE family efflux transporter [Actinomycetota bacterium]
VDTFFIGQLGTEQLAAMGFTIAVVMAASSINMGLGVGTTAVVSKVIGRGDYDAARRLTMDAVFLGIAVSLVLVVAGLLTVDPLFRAMGATDRVLEYVKQYMVIWYIGLPLIVMPQIGNSGIRATGDTKTPAKIMIIAMLCNAVLDPLFMFGIGPFPELGIAGAAAATVTTYAIALALSARALAQRGLFSLERRPFSDTLASWRTIMGIGVPAAVTQLIAPISTGVVTAVVAGYGVAAVAGFGVASRLEMFVFMFVMAMGAALVPFVGQNWGAGHKERVKAAVRVGVTYAMAWGVVAWLIALAFGAPIAAVFNSDPAVVRVVTGYLTIVFPSLTLLGALLVVSQSFNALHRPMRSMALSVLRMFVLYVPLAYAGSALFGLAGVWWAAFTANIIAGVVAIGWF